MQKRREVVTTGGEVPPKRTPASFFDADMLFAKAVRAQTAQRTLDDVMEWFAGGGEVTNADCVCLSDMDL